MNTHSWTPTLSSSNVCQRCGGEYTKFVLECAVCFLLLNRNYCRELLLRGVRPIETFKKLDFQSLFRPQVGPLSAPLPLRQYHPEQGHRRAHTTAFETDLDKEIVHILKNACVVATIVAAMAVLTGSQYAPAHVSHYLLQSGKRYRHLPCLNFGSPETSCYLLSFFVL